MKRSCKPDTIGAVLAGIFLVFLSLPHLSEATPLPEWSNASRDVTPSGRVFLGQFGNDAVHLNLSTLPAHTQVTVSFKLFVIRTWDGNSSDGVGPDQWELGVTGSATSPFLTTFANECCTTQAYPDAFPVGNNPPQTGASEIDTLGYGPDSVYDLTYTFEHTANSLQVNFVGSNLQDLSDESWGLDDVKIEVVNNGQSQEVYQNGFDSSILATNDLFADATPISTLPFTDLVDTRNATTSASDPTSCGSNSHSVWYRYTPTQNKFIEVDTFNSDYEALISVWTGSPASLSPVACGGQQVSFDALAGRTYYVMVSGSGGFMHLHFDEALRLSATFNFGTVNRVGEATISGTVQCSKPSSIFGLFSGSLAQRAGRFRVIRGGFDVFSFVNSSGVGTNECSPTSPLKWSVRVVGDGPFNPGSANVGANVNGCSNDGSTCDDRRSEAVIRLKR